MEVYADIRQKVVINPIDVIEKLIINEIGHGWIKEINGLYYKYDEVGTHRCEISTEISKEKYDYIKSLEMILDYLKNNKK